MSAPSLRVVVRLPGPRPENPISDPPQIEWTAEKADILWKVIERSRSSDSGGADWKGLAAHLQVPLPYLLYRVNARFQEEIRGLKDIQDTLSPTAGQPPPSPYAESVTSPRVGERPTALQWLQTRMNGSTRLSASSRLPTPLGVRARLNSLTNNSPRLQKKVISSSTLTLQASKKGHLPLRAASPFSGSDDDSEDELEARKEEEADRAAEEQETLARKLEDLQRLMTNEAIGLVSTARPRRRSLNGGGGRMGALSPRSVGSSYRPDTLSSRSGSQSVSDSSPQGSIPDIPSPPPDSSQPHSPLGRQFPTDRNGNRFQQNGDRQGHRNYVHSDEYGSSHGSETSSFTDLSDASLSASALESALMSNIRGGGSRISQFTPSRVISRSSRLPRLRVCILRLYKRDLEAVNESSPITGLFFCGQICNFGTFSKVRFQNATTTNTTQFITPIIILLCVGKTMELTFFNDLGNSFVVEIDPNMELENVMALLEAESGIPISEQSISYEQRELTNPKATIRELGVQGESAMMMLRRKVSGGAQDSEMMRLQLLGNPEVMSELRQTQPELAAAAQSNPARFAELLKQTRERHHESELAQQREIERLNMDPFDVDAQQKIEEAIRQQAVMENMQHALEYSPEFFGRVTMLYIQTEVNGHPIKAFVDSGAQQTIMSPETAEACGLMRLLDSRFAGIARGVGTAKILGRVHTAQLKLADLFLPCSFTIMEGRDVDLLFGLDMLKAHQACIDLEKNCLRIQGREVKFLPEHELPDKAREMENEESQGASSSSSSSNAPPSSSATPGGGAGSQGGASSFPGGGRTLGASPSPAAGRSAAPSRAAPAASRFREEDIQKIMEFGATREIAISTLEAAGGNLDVAVSLLF